MPLAEVVPEPVLPEPPILPEEGVMYVANTYPVTDEPLILVCILYHSPLLPRMVTDAPWRITPNRLALVDGPVLTFKPLTFTVPEPLLVDAEPDVVTYSAKTYPFVEPDCT